MIRQSCASFDLAGSSGSAASLRIAIGRRRQKRRFAGPPVLSARYRVPQSFQGFAWWGKLRSQAALSCRCCSVPAGRGPHKPGERGPDRPSPLKPGIREQNNASSRWAVCHSGFRVSRTASRRNRLQASQRRSGRHAISRRSSGCGCCLKNKLDREVAAQTSASIDPTRSAAAIGPLPSRKGGMVGRTGTWPGGPAPAQQAWAPQAWPWMTARAGPMQASPGQDGGGTSWRYRGGSADPFWLRTKLPGSRSAHDPWPAARRGSPAASGRRAGKPSRSRATPCSSPPRSWKPHHIACGNAGASSSSKQAGVRERGLVPSIWRGQQELPPHP